MLKYHHHVVSKYEKRLLCIDEDLSYLHNLQNVFPMEKLKTVRQMFIWPPFTFKLYFILGCASHLVHLSLQRISVTYA